MSTELLEAAEAVEKCLKRGWTQFQYARAPNSKACDALSIRASCWCLLGAIEYAASLTANCDTTTLALSNLAFEAAGGPASFKSTPLRRAWLVEWNDSKAQTRDNVLHTVNKLIDSLRCQVTSTGDTTATALGQ
jgi:hypothetical protein